MDDCGFLRDKKTILDLLGDILTRLSVEGTLYFRMSFTAPWGVEVPAFQNVARFHFAHCGDCMVRITATDETLMLAQGDLVITHLAAIT